MIIYVFGPKHLKHLPVCISLPVIKSGSDIEDQLPHLKIFFSGRRWYEAMALCLAYQRTN